MKILNKFGFDNYLVKSQESDYEYKMNSFSVTSINNKDPKEVLIKKRHNDEMFKDISEMQALIMGNALHSYMERCEDEFVEVDEETYNNFKDIVSEAKVEYEALLGSEDTTSHYFIKPHLKEKRFVYKCEKSPYSLSGYLDLYNLLTNEVSDYKTASVNKYLFKDWEDYRRQLLMYAVLLQANKLPCNNGKLIVFFKDYSPQKAKVSSEYPPHSIYEIKYEFTYEEINRMREEIEEYFLKLVDKEKLSDDEIEPCTPEHRRFNRKSDFAIMKIGNKRATKVCDSSAEANNYMLKNGLNKGFEIVERVAEESKCKEYCDACHWCNHYINNYATVFIEDLKGHKLVGFDDIKEAEEFKNNNFEKYGLTIISTKEGN